MREKNKKKKIIIFLGFVAILAIILFWPDSGLKEEERPVRQEIKTEQMTDSSLSSPEETIDPEEQAEAEEVNKNTSFWMWEGKESGESSKEFITLRGDGIYILRIELDEHDPVDETGEYRELNHDGTRLLIPYKKELKKGIINGNQLIVEDKVFKKIEDMHV